MEKFVTFEPLTFGVKLPEQLKRTAIICVICDGHKYYSGVAILNPKDKYNPQIGSKVALRKALKNVPKKHREIIWADYFKACAKGVFGT